MDVQKVWGKPGLTPHEMIVMVCVTDMADRRKGMMCYPSEAEIARRCGWAESNTKPVHTALVRLEAMGLISRHDQPSKNGKRTTKVVHVHPDTVPERIPADLGKRKRKRGRRWEQAPEGARPPTANESQGVTPSHGGNVQIWGTPTHTPGARPPMNREPNRELSKNEEVTTGAHAREAGQEIPPGMVPCSRCGKPLWEHWAEDQPQPLMCPSCRMDDRDAAA